MLGLKLSDRVRNDKLRKITKVEAAKKKARRLKWQWAGHICRMDDNRWTKRLTEWFPYDGNRKHGHPRKRWRDIFNELVGDNWMQKARDREVWKQMGEAYATEATTIINNC